MVPDSQKGHYDGDVFFKRHLAKRPVRVVEAIQEGDKMIVSDGDHGGEPDGGGERIPSSHPVPEREHVFPVYAESVYFIGVCRQSYKMERDRLVRTQMDENHSLRVPGVG